MAELVSERMSLADITSHEIEKYVGRMSGAAMYALLDEKHKRYGVVIVPENDTDRPAYVAVMARIIDDYVVIDEDGTVDKPLYQALMVNAGVPREKIVLAYKGEKVPDQS